MPHCCAVNCSSRPDRGYKLFRIPQGERNAERRRLWLHRIGRKDQFSCESAKLCELHFTPDQFENNREDGVRKLKPNALPSIFSHRPAKKERKPPKSRDVQDDLDGSLNTDLDPVNEVDDAFVVDGSSDGSGQNVQGPTENPLQAEIENLQRKLQLSQKKLHSANEQMESMAASMKHFLNEDQLAALGKKTMRGTKWSSETIKKALKIRLACGSSGYNTVRELGQPLPSERTLQRNLEQLLFKPGILDDMVSALKVKVDTLKPQEKHAALMLDEMSITPGLQYDISSKVVIGHPTLPGANSTFDSHACHALVFMLGGLSTRWKQVVGYHFTGKSISSVALKSFLWNLIKRCEGIGLTIDVIVSDMGGQNQALWRECGIVTGRYHETKNYCQHPCSSERKLYFMPDVPHILKNLRNHLTNLDEMFLPTAVVQANNLPVPVVSIQPVHELYDADVKNKLNIAWDLRENVLRPGHYEKMKVGLAYALLNHSVAAAIKYAVEQKILEDSAMTTAYFIETIFRWFKLMTSRNRKTAMSNIVEEKHDDAVQLLKDVIYLFENIKIGKRGAWKPVQSAIILATTTALNIQDYLLNEKGFLCVLLCRLSQDALENLFSTVRTNNPVPDALSFKNTLRLIAVSQYFRPAHYGNYQEADAEFLADYLEYRRTSDDSECANDVPPVETVDISDMEEILPEEKQSLYYLAGRTMQQIKRRYVICEKCEKPLHAKNSECEELRRLTDLKNYSDSGHLLYASQEVFNILTVAENIFRVNEKLLLASQISTKDLETDTLAAAKNLVHTIPSCHSVVEKMIHVFISTRMYIVLKKHNRIVEMPTKTKYSSKSMRTTK